ncbi:MAG: hypothetical protein R2748_10985 [Bryobacterales bacterium]
MASFASHAKKKLGPEALYEYAVAAAGPARADRARAAAEAGATRRR